MTALTERLDEIEAMAEATFSVPEITGPLNLIGTAANVPMLTKALRAVLALHQPIDALMNPGRHERVVKVCTGCGTDGGNYQRHPCPTVRAIAAALAGEA